MPADQVYKMLELTGTSSDSIEKAVTNAVERAAKTVRNMSWFQVCETRGRIEDNKVSQWQVTIKIGFRIDDQP